MATLFKRKSGYYSSSLHIIYEILTYKYRKVKEKLSTYQLKIYGSCLISYGLLI